MIDATIESSNAIQFSPVVSIMPLMAKGPNPGFCITLSGHISQDSSNLEQFPSAFHDLDTFRDYRPIIL